MDYSLCSNNWCSELKEILSLIGLSEYYNNKMVINPDYARSKIFEYYSSIWEIGIENVSKLRTYTSFKTEFETEKYVSLSMKRNERSLLARLRCGILPLRVETGRYIGERVEDRLCRFCTDQCIENEPHFVVKCSFYRHIRSEYFGELFNTNDFNSKTDSEKLVYLINDKSRTLAKYIVKSYSYRREGIYR